MIAIMISFMRETYIEMDVNVEYKYAHITAKISDQSKLVERGRTLKPIIERRSYQKPFRVLIEYFEKGNCIKRNFMKLGGVFPLSGKFEQRKLKQAVWVTQV